MLCQICQVREATIKFIQIVNNQKKEVSLCKICAEEKGFTNPLASLPQLFGGLILALLDEGLTSAETKVSKVRCSGCGLTMTEFEKTGLLGCAECYDAFEEELKKMLRRIHGSNKHIGSRPTARRIRVPKPDLTKLRRELSLAVKKENYEKAAELRDIIRDAERALEE